jgi:hypothetical protein
LLDRHINRVLVAVSVQTDLMPGIANRCHVFWKSLQAMSGYEPCCLDIVLVKQLQKALCAHGTSKEPSTDVAGAVFATI